MLAGLPSEIYNARPARSGESVILGVEKRTIGVDVDIVSTIVGGVSVLLRGVYAFRVVGDAVHERVVGVFMARGVVSGEMGIVGAYASVPPGVIVGDGM